MRLRLSFAALFLAASALLANDNWPQFRGPNGDGISDSTNVPTKWSETNNVRWKTQIHDRGWSSPVVWGNQVWVTTAQEDGTDYYAVCLDRKTGKVIYDLKLFHQAAPKPNTKQFNSYASPTPAIEAGRVYIHFGSHGTACLDTATGKTIWSRTDLPCDHFRGPASSPIIYKDWLYLTFDGFDRQYVACLNKLTGKTVWQKDRDLPYINTGRVERDGDLKKAFATPSVLEFNGRPQLVSPAAMGTIAYDPATGEELWRVITGGMNEASRPILAHGLIYVTAGHISTLFAVRAGGSGDLTKSGVAWKVAKQAPTRSSPLVLGDLLFMVNDNGMASCLNAKTGKELWRESLGSRFSASPVFAGGNIYFCSEDGRTFVVAAEREFKLLEENKLPGGFMASPAIAGHDLFLRTGGRSDTKGFLYCIGK
jgi:outer membrane protein assembly factor BamB